MQIYVLTQKQNLYEMFGQLVISRTGIGAGRGFQLFLRDFATINSNALICEAKDIVLNLNILHKLRHWTLNWRSGDCSNTGDLSSFLSGNALKVSCKEFFWLINAQAIFS